MRVLLVTKHRTGGGTEKHVADVVSGLAGRMDISAAYLEDGFWPLQWTIERGGYDIIHFFLPRPYLLGSLACRLSWSPALRIMSRRSLRSCYQKPWIRWIEERLHRRTILVGNSPAVCAELAEEVPRDRTIFLLRNGVSMRPFGHIPSPVFRMLCVANMFPYKGHADLFAAIERIRADLPKSWMLTLVGKGTEKFDWPGQDPHIIGLGYDPNVAQHLANADLFILPSHEEGSSNALLEAMAAGVPVIATSVGGNVDAVTTGCGVLIPPKNPAALAGAILALAEDPGLRSKLAANAQKMVAEKFGFERMLNDYETLYRAALKGARAVHRPVR